MGNVCTALSTAAGAAQNTHTLHDPIRDADHARVSRLPGVFFALFSVWESARASIHNEKGGAGLLCRETSGETHLISTEVQQDLTYE